jgi:UDP-N-acetylglucosamine 2-epimerase
MLDQVLDLFGIKPEYDLNIMQERQTLAQVTSRALEGVEKVIAEARPAIVLVHGDTTTTMAASLAAFYEHCPVGHVEAGLRSGDKYFPFPEEINRKVTGAIADLHFSPTARARENLLREGVPAEKIFVTGNTVIDALATTVKYGYQFQSAEIQEEVDSGRKYIAVEVHRRENWGQPLDEVCQALRDIVREHQDVDVMFSVHRNPIVRESVSKYLTGEPRVHLFDPVNAGEWHNLMAASTLIVTDSGGLQEEAPALGKPVLVARDVTERPEAVEAGTVKLVGPHYDAIVRTAHELLTNPGAYAAMAGAKNPFGDGHASERIARALLYWAGQKLERPEDFA